MNSGDLQNGDIILTSRSFKSSPISGVIKVGTVSKYSHAMIYVGSQKVVEAVGEGIIKRSLSEALNGCDVKTAYRHAEITDIKAQKIVMFVEDKIGGEYASPGVASGSGIIGFALAPISGPFMLGRAIQNARLVKKGKKRSYFCSELVADAYYSAGLPLGIYGRTPSFMNPGDIDEYSSRNSKTLVKLGNL